MKDSDNYHGDSGLDGEHHEDDAGSITLSPKHLNPKLLNPIVLRTA